MKLISKSSIPASVDHSNFLVFELQNLWKKHHWTRMFMLIFLFLNPHGTSGFLQIATDQSRCICWAPGIQLGTPPTWSFHPIQEADREWRGDRMDWELEHVATSKTQYDAIRSAKVGHRKSADGSSDSRPFRQVGSPSKHGWNEPKTSKDSFSRISQRNHWIWT